jgi:hypothetical protein
LNQVSQKNTELGGRVSHPTGAEKNESKVVRKMRSMSQYGAFDLDSRFRFTRGSRRTPPKALLVRALIHALAILSWAVGLGVGYVLYFIWNAGLPENAREVYYLWYVFKGWFDYALIGGVAIHLVANYYGRKRSLFHHLAHNETEVRPIGLLKKENLTERERHVVDVFDAVQAQHEPGVDVFLLLNNALRSSVTHYVLPGGVAFVSLSPTALVAANDEELQKLFHYAFAQIESKPDGLMWRFREAFNVQPLSVAYRFMMAMFSQTEQHNATHGARATRNATIAGAAVGGGGGAAVGMGLGGIMGLIMIIMAFLAAFAAFLIAIPMAVMKLVTGMLVQVFEPFWAFKPVFGQYCPDTDIASLKSGVEGQSSTVVQAIQSREVSPFGMENWLNLLDIVHPLIEHRKKDPGAS